MSSTDPFQSLHRMSTTAGVSSTEYVAINLPAIISPIVAVIGCVLLFVFFDYLFLLIPVAALILAIIAITQIRRSNGTQSGLAMAILGLLISTAATTTSLALQIHQSYHDRADQKAIADLCTRYGQCVAKSDPESLRTAYSLFTPTFQKQIPPAEFVALIHQYRQEVPIDAVAWAGLTNFSDLEDGSRAADITLICYINGQQLNWRPNATVRQINGVWKFENILEQFPTKKKWKQLTANP